MQALSASCEPDLTAGPAMLLDLAGVKFADRRGAQELRPPVRKGATLVGRSGCVLELLRQSHSQAGPIASHRIGAEPDGESELLERLRAGDSTACETLVRQHGGRMLATARRFLLNDQDAQDAVQDAFLSAFKGMDRFSGGAKLSTWLHRIVVNACLMKLRSRRRKPEQPIDDLLPRFDGRGQWVDMAAGSEIDGDALLQRRETRAMVRRCIEQLPETYRTVLIMRDIEELDTDEAAATLGITANALKIRLPRARQALRTLIERELSGS